MDRSNKRLSLSTSNLSSPPIAESTHLLQQKFPWGSGLNKSPINYMKNSPENSLSRNSNNNVLEQKSSINNNTIKNFNSKIDPKIYTDAQSRGLASRIVRYHDNNLKLNRCLSMTNLYNKPGQFPVVHLKKTKLPVKLNRNQSNVSMIKIAPPVRSVFQANSRASILRSCSAVGILEKSTELSHDDRPILHPNENEQNGTPTRSVLEVLKEISRKRINSDELDISTDNVKKYCRESNIVPDNYQNNNDIDIQENAKNGLICSKRQREMSNSPNSHLNTSPEQISKRRLYSCSNDISSSLSSSLSMTSPKRKMLSDDDRTGPHIQKTKTQKQMSNNNQILLSDKSIKMSETKTIPKDDLDGTENLNVSMESSTTAISTPLRNVLSEPIIKTAEPVKPKLTLFNKNYSTDCISVVQDDFDEENVRVSFVKPKKSSLKLSRNSLIEKAQKSKLALMLSSLKGELPGEDEIDSVENKSNESPRAEKTAESSKQESNKSNTEILDPPMFASVNTIENPAKEKPSKEVIEKSNFVAPKPLSISPTVATNKNKVQENNEILPKSGGFSFGLTSSNVETTKSVAPVIAISTAPKVITLPSISTSTPTTTNSFSTVSSIGMNNTMNNNPISFLAPAATISNNSTFVLSSITTNAPLISASNAETTVLKEPFRISSGNETIQKSTANSITNFTSIGSSSTPQFTIAPNKNDDKPIGSQGSFSFPFRNEPIISQAESFNIPKSNDNLNSSKNAICSDQMVPSNVNAGFKPLEFSEGKTIGGFNFGLENPKSVSFGQNAEKNISPINNSGNNLPIRSTLFAAATGPATLSFGQPSASTGVSFFDSSVSSTKNSEAPIKIAESNQSKDIQTHLKSGGFSFNNDKAPVFGNNMSDSVKVNEATAKNVPFSFGMNSQSNQSFVKPDSNPRFVKPDSNPSFVKPDSNPSNSFNFSGNTSIFGSKTNESNTIENKPNSFNIDGNNDGKSIFGTNQTSNNNSETARETNNFTFGGINKVNNAPVFGSNTNNFSFASNNTFAFGSNTNSTKSFSFAENDPHKAISGTSTNAQSTDKPFAFGAEKQTETFKFGENKSSAGAEKSFTFGDKSNLHGDKGFAFGDNNKSTNSVANNTFTFGEKAAPSSFSFNANTNAPVQPANNFSITTGNALAATNQDKSFNFGAPAANQSFAFSGAQNANNQVQQSNTFNFMSPANNSGLNTTGMASNNLFSPGPGDRVIRKATRRLQK